MDIVCHSYASHNALKAQMLENAQKNSVAALLWFLFLMFALRVFGQALQHWNPQPFLPPFAAFQGSNLPYRLLLSVQVVILMLMARFAWHVQTGIAIPRRRVGTALAWFGSIYMLGSVARIVVGLAVPTASAWFSTWIPAIFHVTLAGYVLSLSYYHLRLSRPLTQKQQV